MAWEKLAASQGNSATILIPAGLSAIWIALVIAAALLTSFDEPYLPFAIAGGMAFFLRSRPSRWEIYAWLLISALFIKIVHLPQIPFWVLRVASGFAVLGFGAFVLLGLRVLWSEREDQGGALALLLPALVLTLFIVVCARVLRVTSGLSPLTDDAWLYAFDGSLGFQPSFLMGRIMFSSLILTRCATLTYLSLPFAMALVCAWQKPDTPGRFSWHMLTVILLAGVAGWLVYNVVPGTGPIYAFGPSFPYNEIPYKDLSTFALQKMSLPTSIPRNAMPSLHMGWVVLLWWNSRGLPRILRMALVLYVGFTMVATLGAGQHYFVDLVVSLPFALAVQAAASYTVPAKSRRMAAMIAGIGLTAAWLALIRFAVPLALKNPLIPWLLILVTISLTIWLASWMSKDESTGMSPERAPETLRKFAHSAR